VGNPDDTSTTVSEVLAQMESIILKRILQDN
jgi:hypothetical protein